MMNMLLHEFFSSDEDMFSRGDFLMSKFLEEGVNVIVPCFNDSIPVEIEYCSKPIVAPVVIFFPGLFLKSQIKLFRTSTVLLF